MSYFHKVPPKEVLREEALKKSETYFKQHHLNISPLSLITISVPEKNPLKDFPRASPFKKVWKECFCPSTKEKTKASRCVGGCIDNIFIFVFIFFFWFCNFVSIIDCVYKGEVSHRIDLVRLLLLIYPEGVLLYNRRIPKFNYSLLCFCWDRSYYEYCEYFESIEFIPWESIELPVDEIKPEDKFMAITLGHRSVLVRRKVFNLIHEIFSKYHMEHNT
eukprot:snap_masked-scaffold_31-processed-gene-3.36-mRNA-1 protein AED:0.88 eAED:1.00 QI:0/-1/0/1/-1/1/1/0/217